MINRNLDRARLKFTASFAGLSVAILTGTLTAGPNETDTINGDSAVQSIIVVAPEAFRPGLAKWTKRRQKAGHVMTIVRPRSTAEATQHEINIAVATDKEAGTTVRAIVLVGDMPVVGRHCNPTREVPTNYPPSKVTRPWGAPPTIASDSPFGDFDGDGKVDATVGRLPFSSPEDVQSYLDRVIAYEDSRDFGPWRSRIQLTGGIGGFGEVADAAIESVTRTIVTGVLPAETKTAVAYASPGHRYHPPGNSFRDAVIDRYNDGCAYWIYAGHGWIDHLDKVPPTFDGTPVLDSKSVANLNRSAAAAPVAVMLSCYTGAIDADKPPWPNACWRTTAALSQSLRAAV